MLKITELQFVYFLFRSIGNALVLEHLKFSRLQHTVEARYVSERKKMIRVKNKYFQIMSV